MISYVVDTVVDADNDNNEKVRYNKNKIKKRGKKRKNAQGEIKIVNKIMEY